MSTEIITPTTEQLNVLLDRNRRTLATPIDRRIARNLVPSIKLGADPSPLPDVWLTRPSLRCLKGLGYLRAMQDAGREFPIRISWTAESYDAGQELAVPKFARPDYLKPDFRLHQCLVHHHLGRQFPLRSAPTRAFVSLTARCDANGFGMPDHRDPQAYVPVRKLRDIRDATIDLIAADAALCRRMADAALLCAKRLGLSPLRPGHVVWTAFAGGDQAQAWLLRAADHPRTPFLYPLEPLHDVQDWLSRTPNNANNYDYCSARVANAWLTACRVQDHALDFQIQSGNGAGP